MNLSSIYNIFWDKNFNQNPTIYKGLKVELFYLSDMNKMKKKLFLIQQKNLWNNQCFGIGGLSRAFHHNTNQA